MGLHMLVFPAEHDSRLCSCRAGVCKIDSGVLGYEVTSLGLVN